MKIPNSVRIGGVDYEVKMVETLNDGTHMLDGQIDYCNSVIELKPNERNHQVKCQTLWHEIVHGICYDRDLSIRDNEDLVDALAKGIYQVLQDNAAAMFDLEKVTK